MGTKMTYPGFHPVARHDGIFQEKIHDAYKIKGKLAEPTVYPVCNAVFHEGRWHWSAAPVDAHRHNCPACQRIMAVEEKDNATLITTTDIHLARSIAEAIHHAYQGHLEFHYNLEENLLRAQHWSH
jgi:hypothetical protein